MLSGWLLFALAVAYLCLLFAIAFYGERRSNYPNRPRLRPCIYSLALGAYCASRIFYGAVGRAVRAGWDYLPVYLGPTLRYVFGLPLRECRDEIGRARTVGSIADFIASRLGKSRSLAVRVTRSAFSAAVPYLALRLNMIGGRGTGHGQQ